MVTWNRASLAVLVLLGAVFFLSTCYDGSSSDACTGVTCSGHGTCESLDDQTTPRCRCDPGYRADGLECEPPTRCVASDCTWVFADVGSFVMGSLDEEAGRSEDEGWHRVVLTRDVIILTTEVTQLEVESVMGYTSAHFVECGDDCPVEQVSWHEAAAYCNALSSSAGLVGCYSCTGEGLVRRCEPSSDFESPQDCPGYRLPTEAEWEFAARAASNDATYRGDIDPDAPGLVLDSIAWYQGNTVTPHPVGQLTVNNLGLHDMLGNVWEWCHDFYGEYPSTRTDDPSGPENGEHRVVRGGGWNGAWTDCRAAARGSSSPDDRGSALGFRVVQTWTGD